MGSREVRITVAGVAALVLVCWLVGFGGHLKVAAQLDAATDPEDGPVSFGQPLNTGIIPAAWQAHMPSGAHLGRHRMYQHPGECSPGMTALMSQAWRYAPPSEGDL